MKQTKLSKSIKIVSLISYVILFIWCFASTVAVAINWNVAQDWARHLVYDIYKYLALSAIVLAVIPIVLSFVEIFINVKKNKYYFYRIFNNGLAALLSIVCLMLLFITSEKYYIVQEIWYGHISFYTSLMVLLDCLLLREHRMHTKKCYQVKNNDFNSLLTVSIKNTFFLPEIIWIGFGAITGFVGMFYIKDLAQITSMWILTVSIYLTLHMSFMFYLNYSKNKAKTWDASTTFTFILLIISGVILAYVISAYYVMYPIRIIDIIHLNYLAAGWLFTLPVLLCPAYLITARKYLK